MALPSHSRAPFLLAMAATLFIVGGAVRMIQFSSEARTLHAATEDGYLMLTVARNLGLGRGLTIADGTMVTNGVQPAITVAWAGIHRINAGDRLSSLRAILLIEGLLALLSAWAVGRLGLRSFTSSDARALSWVAAGLWFAAPVVVRHTSNGLETGAVALGLGLFLLAEPRWRASGWRGALSEGLALGTLFLIRNDAVFFIVAWAAVSAWHDGWRDRRWGAWASRSALAGLGALAVATPWLLFNLATFGHIVPISGRAQNLNVSLGENLVALPRVLAEYAWMWSPLPSWLGERPAAAWSAGLVLAFVAAALLRSWRALGFAWSREWSVLLLASALLAGYYGVFFGASYFLSRYLIGLSLLTVLAAATLVGAMLGRAPRAGPALAIGLTLLLSIALARQAARGATHPHMPVVDWVEAHVPDTVWVGAPQSGTLGYFHDRTINLDGKVNPWALAARRDGRLFAYIVDDTPIEYLADWMGLARWVEAPSRDIEDRDPRRLADHFEVLVKDPAQNLVVLRRR